jgi:type I restriction enzyme M protein
VAKHPEFVALSEKAHGNLAKWVDVVRPRLLSIDADTKPKDLVAGLASSLLATFEGTPLVSAYALYQGLMEYWAESMQDDVYLVADVGWLDGAAMKALPAKKKGEKRTGRVDFIVNKVEYRSELVAPELVKYHFFAEEARRVDEALAVAQAVVEELESNYAGEDMILSDCANDKGQFTKKVVVEALKVTPKTDEEHAPLTEVLAALDAEAAAAKAAKDFEAKVYARYAKLTADEVVKLVVDDAWLETIRGLLESALTGASMRLTERLTELDCRYKSTLGVLSAHSRTLGDAVAAHLASMGFEV